MTRLIKEDWKTETYETFIEGLPVWFVREKFTNNIKVSPERYKDYLEPEEILCIVVERTGTTIDEIRSKSRKAKIVRTRHLFCLIASIATKAKHEEIALLINRDRTAVIWAINNAFNMIETKHKDYLLQMELITNS